MGGRVGRGDRRVWEGRRWARGASRRTTPDAGGPFDKLRVDGCGAGRGGGATSPPSGGSGRASPALDLRFIKMAWGRARAGGEGGLAGAGGCGGGRGARVVGRRQAREGRWTRSGWTDVGPGAGVVRPRPLRGAQDAPRPLSICASSRWRGVGRGRVERGDWRGREDAAMGVGRGVVGLRQAREGRWTSSGWTGCGAGRTDGPCGGGRVGEEVGQDVGQDIAEDAWSGLQEAQERPTPVAVRRPPRVRDGRCTACRTSTGALIGRRTRRPGPAARAAARRRTSVGTVRCGVSSAAAMNRTAPPLAGSRPWPGRAPGPAGQPSRAGDRPACFGWPAHARTYYRSSPGAFGPPAFPESVDLVGSGDPEFAGSGKALGDLGEAALEGGLAAAEEDGDINGVVAAQIVARGGAGG